MKKIVFLIAILVATIVACVPAHSQNPVIIYRYATATTPLGRYIVSGNFVANTYTKQIYQLTKDFGPTATISSIITDGHYAQYTVNSSGAAYSATSAAISAWLTVPYAVFTHTFAVNDSASNGIFSVKVKAPYLDGTYLHSTHSFTTNDSTTNLIASGAASAGTTIVAGSTVQGTYWHGTATDTATAAPVGSIIFKVSDSTFYGKIRLDGTKGARWKKLN